MVVPTPGVLITCNPLPLSSARIQQRARGDKNKEADLRMKRLLKYAGLNEKNS